LLSSLPTTYNEVRVSPDELYGELFREVQLRRLFKDSKAFADAVPLHDSAEIILAYNRQKSKADFDLKSFVDKHFEMPSELKTDHGGDAGIPPIEEHIEWLWSRLSRPVKAQHRGGSLLVLPDPYVVPGGRFREIYYWDSYFTMLGLRVSGRNDLVESMVRNFVHLIDHFGHVPTGNRTYYLSRSPPPFFSLMIRLLSEVRGVETLVDYLPQLQKEHDFWMDGNGRLNADEPAYRRVVRLPDGTLLNRYWDDRATPRPEAYAEDVELAKEAKEKYGHEPESVYRCLRAAAESGWDFSSRWMADGKSFATIQTTNVLPVDLNCLLHHLEATLAEAYRLGGYPDTAKEYELIADKRKAAIDTYFWDESRSFYMDYDFQQQKFTNTFSLAAVFPLFFELADKQQARAVKSRLEENFLRSGGMLSTLTNSGQQWDLPNGWAPLQWIAHQGLRHYKFNRTAGRLRTNWLNVVEKKYKAEGKLLEKYNVIDTNLLPCDGEYEIQEGFGWTNGVYLAMKNRLRLRSA